MLTIIDVFSKYAWDVPVKDKSGKSVTDVKMVGRRHPNNLWVDQGTEFNNKTFRKFLEDNKISMYHTFNFGKAVVVERFNRTLKRIMRKYFTANNTKLILTLTNYQTWLTNITYNTQHSSIKLTPTEASKPENKGRVYFNLYGKFKEDQQISKYKIGDVVRISKHKRYFEKWYTPNWTEEIFVVYEILNTNSVK